MGSLGRPVRFLEETGSTNDDARAWGREGAGHGALVSADAQHKGRGRRGNEWASPPGRNLLFSLVLRPEQGLETWPRVTALAAGALWDAVTSLVTCDSVRVKWPNDLYAEGKKLAGMLAESDRDASGNPFLVLGIGLNVNILPVDLPVKIQNSATSLRTLNGGRLLDRDIVLQRVLEKLEEWLPRLGTEEFLTALPELTGRQLHLGRLIRCDTGGRRLTGEFLGLDEYGGMRLRVEEGKMTLRSADEVRLVDEPSN